MKKKYCPPKINSVTLDRSIVLMMVTGNEYQHRHRHRHNVQPKNDPFGGSKPFPDSPEYNF